MGIRRDWDLGAYAFLSFLHYFLSIPALGRYHFLLIEPGFFHNCHIAVDMILEIGTIKIDYG